MKSILRSSVTILLLVMALALPETGRASVSSDVQALVTEATDLHNQLLATQVSADAVCAPLVSASQAAHLMVKSIDALNDALAAPITIDDSLLTALEDLSVTNVQIADEVLRLATAVQLLAPTVDALSLKDGLTAMLQLSDDIGAMADRIGEMADKILVMADNIGLMADRILVSQQIQSDNLALTQGAILQTQTNMLTLVSVVETATYDLDLNSLIAQGELLAADLAATVFSPLTIKYQLAAAAADIKDFQAQVLAVAASIKDASVTSTMVVDDSTMLALANMSIMASSVATVLDGYNLALESMVGALTDRNLSASLASMLEMSADIGVMANSILEMADLILVMADNIGLSADQIILTQQVQSSYMAITQASILATQEMAIGIIVAEAL